MKEMKKTSGRNFKDHMDCPSSFDGFLGVKQSKMLTLKRKVLTFAVVHILHTMGRQKTRRGMKYSCFKCNQSPMVH
jgi:hypothetical protein